MIISLDTETTGVDLHHGARPFFVTICREDGEQLWWEWDVDPLTRKVKVSYSDLREVCREVEEADAVVLQNAKFDIAALNGHWERFGRYWPWHKTHDTLFQAHLLTSNLPKDLTSLATTWLGRDIQPYEDALEVEVKKARQWAKTNQPEWRLAKKDLPEMPSAKDKTWKYDCWLPKVVDTESVVLRDYSNVDSAVTLQAYSVMKAEIERRGLTKIYEDRRKLLPIVYSMESRGLTLSGERLEELITRYGAESKEAGARCVRLAAAVGHEIELPKGGVNGSLRKVCFEGFNLPRVYSAKSKTGEPTLDENAMAVYLNELPRQSAAYKFIDSLSVKRKRDTAISYMESYRRFWLPISRKHLGWYRLHPSLNATGTDTLRWSSNSPNEQNISKKEDSNVRYCFGPMPGREWWAMDGKNLELRIPAYEAGEEEFIELFERPDDPPYYGSNHLLIAHLLFPKQFEECLRNGEDFKTKYKSTIYQDVKNGNFAVQYGAVDRDDGLGTADRTYKLPGAQRKIKAKFSKMESINQKWIAFANKHGYVETLPDKSVDPDRGYPLLCSRSEWGKIKPTIPLNYHVQGTACWWMARAMIRCHEQLEAWRVSQNFDGFITAQIHDELVFDLPYKANRGNLPKIRLLKRLMEQGGTDIGVPTPVSIEYHPNNYSEGVPIT